MSDQHHDAAATPSPDFFNKLPREIRDHIYKFYCNNSPRQSGPLEGYVDMPSTAPLKVCKQMHNELAPILYASLKETILKEHVLFKLQSTEDPSRALFMGWSEWVHVEPGRVNLNIWIREGIEEPDYAAFWVDTCNLNSLGQSILSKNPVKDHLSDTVTARAFQKFLQTLVKLQLTYLIDTNSTAMMASNRLNAVFSRIQVQLRELRRLETVTRARIRKENRYRP